jgi:hypothetical protein
MADTESCLRRLAELGGEDRRGEAGEQRTYEMRSVAGLGLSRLSGP